MDVKQWGENIRSWADEQWHGRTEKSLSSKPIPNLLEIVIRPAVISAGFWYHDRVKASNLAPIPSTLLNRPVAKRSSSSWLFSTLRPPILILNV